MTDRRNGDPRRGTDDVAVTLAVVANDVKHIKSNMDKLVTRNEFEPVRNIVYGLAGLILVGVVAGLLALVV